MRRNYSILAIGVLVLWAGCMKADLGQSSDLVPPAVEWLSLGDIDPPEPPLVETGHPIRVRFTKPLDPFTLIHDTVLVVRGLAKGSCAEMGDCGEDLCLEGTCFAKPVDAAFLKDANKPPLAASRMSRVVPAVVAMTADGAEVWLSLREALVRPGRYALVLSASLRDRQGNPLVSQDGRQEGFVYDFVTGLGGGPLPTLWLLQPAGGSNGVPANIPEVVVGVSDEVRGIEEDGLWIEGPTGRVPSTISLLQEGCPDEYHSCYRLGLEAPLAPLSVHRLHHHPRVCDANGRSIPGSEDRRFATGAGSDTTPPTVSNLEWVPEGGCLELRFVTNEPARALVRVVNSGGVIEQALDGFGTDHLGAVSMYPLPTAILVEAWDAVGNQGQLGPLSLDVDPLAPVAISEVLANPAGPEPAQEYVEIVNLGPEAVSLSGWRLTDTLAKPGDQLPDESLPPGAIALVVPSTYRPEDPSDPAPIAGTVLLRLSSSTLGYHGLSNSGEPAYLLDQDGRVVSSFPGAAYDGKLPANGQSVFRHLGVGCLGRGPWRLQPDGSSTPGWLE